MPDKKKQLFDGHKVLTIPTDIPDAPDREAEEQAKFLAEKTKFYALFSQQNDGLDALAANLHRMEKHLSSFQKDIEYFQTEAVETATTMTMLNRIDVIKESISRLQFDLGFAQNDWAQNVSKVLPDAIKNTTANILFDDLTSVKAVLKDDEILLKMPMLPHLETSMEFGKIGKKYYRFSTKLYEQSVVFAMKNVLAGNEKTRQSLKKKVLHYMFIYNKNDHMIDTDSHDTRTVTNAITWFLPGGDESKCCDIIYETRQSESLNQGTYIWVYPMEKRHESLPVLEVVFGEKTS